MPRTDAAPARAILLTGSNRGDRAALLEQARRLIEARVGPVVRASSVHESEPWGFEDPQSFLNQALIVETTLSPIALLDELQAIERELGRVRNDGKREGYAPRPIDIDILFYDDLVLDSERLTLPHPLIGEREFVLTPLREIAPDLALSLSLRTGV